MINNIVMKTESVLKEGWALSEGEVINEGWGRGEKKVSKWWCPLSTSLMIKVPIMPTQLQVTPECHTYQKTNTHTHTYTDAHKLYLFLVSNCSKFLTINWTKYDN